MKSPDEFLIDVFQNIYNWVWNRFGITKAALECFLCLNIFYILYIIEGIPNVVLYLLLFFIFMQALLIWPKEHKDQLNNEFDKLNKDAISHRNKFYHYGFRYLLIMVSIITVFGFLYNDNYMEPIDVRLFLFATALQFLWEYLNTALISNRVQTETKHEFSYGSTGGL